MTPEQVLALPSRILTQAQRESYFENGYILLEKAVSAEWLAKLCAASDEMVERSRKIIQSDSVFDLEHGHSAHNPRLRRVSSPPDRHPAFWDFLAKSSLGDVVADLVGPDVKFHHSKLNYKWAQGGEEVKWHYDISFWPHTNYSPLTVGVYLHDCGMDQGPLAVVPKSHEQDLFNQYNDAGEWTGFIADRDLARVDLKNAKYLTGRAGSITIHNCRTVHGSPLNRSGMGRPLLLYTLSSADAFPYTPNPIPSRYSGALIRGQPARHAHHDPRPCLVPPDWSTGYTSIFAVQQGEKG